MPTATLDRRERPRRPRRVKGKGWALVLAIAVQLGFLAVLVFSIQWQRRPPEALSVELYAPPPKAPAPQPVQPPPEPKPEPKPEPPPPEPKPEPTPPPKPPEPVVEKPDTRAADIALKAKQEQEKRRKEEQERLAREEAAKAKLAQERRVQDERRKAEEKQKADEKAKADKDRERRQQQELAAMRAQADREKDLLDQAAREQAQRNAQQEQQRAAFNKGLADWTSRISAKIRGNVIVPPDIVGNPEAIFDVVQLPTGEVIEVTLRKSSGNRAYDEAVQRAIMKSSPLPRPDRPDIFQRVLNLKFRPRD